MFERWPLVKPVFWHVGHILAGMPEIWLYNARRFGVISDRSGTLPDALAHLLNQYCTLAIHLANAAVIWQNLSNFGSRIRALQHLSHALNTVPKGGSRVRFWRAAQNMAQAPKIWPTDGQTVWARRPLFLVWHLPQKTKNYKHAAGAAGATAVAN